MQSAEPNKATSAIGRKIREKGFSGFVSTAWGYLRGYVASYRFESRVPVIVRGGLRITKRNGVIDVGARTEFFPDVKLACWAVAKDRPAVLTIGRYCSIGDRTEIHAGERVQIGDRVSISWDCVILDRDYHGAGGGPEGSAPVVLETGVWIGCRSIILKGVTIGEGAVVAAGSVVTKDVEARTLVAGNPARFVRRVDARGE